MNKVIVISVDAMIGEDMKVLRAMPELKELFSKSSAVVSVLPVMPSLTYPCHVSILTGCYPDKHGIINNEVFSPGVKGAPWFWYTSYHKRPSLFKWAKEKGLSTACVAWPSTSSCPDVDYQISKIFAVGEEDELNTPNVKDIYQRHMHLIDGFVTDNLDEFSELCTREIISRFKPDLTLSYFALIDSQRHKLGFETEKHVEALERVGRRIARIVEETKKAGIYEDTTFFITSDHGQINNKYTFSINEVLRQKGYIDTDENGNVTDWRIYAQSAAFTCQIHSRNISDSEVFTVLNEIKGEYPECVDRILNRYESRIYYHTDGDYTFLVEGLEGVSYSGDLFKPVIVKAGSGDYKTAIATHGHSPERGSKPTFVVAGKLAKPGVIVPEASLVDEAPTILKCFGIDMDEVDGKAVEEILEV